MTNAGKVLKILGLILLAIIVILLILFNIPYSPVKKQFDNDLESIVAKNTGSSTDVFAEEDFADYPLAIRKYIENNGFIGQKKMAYTYMVYKDVEFAQAPDRKLKIDYRQYNFANSTDRIALIDSSMVGVPFEGYDYYISGQGGMKGVLGKFLTLFEVKGHEMDKGALCTYLAECLFVPASILDNSNITFEEIYPYSVYATIEDSGSKVYGIFTFNEDYEMTKFYTEDRPSAQDDGTVKYAPWSANVLSYKETQEGVNFIDHVQIIWHYPEGDFTYFDGKVDTVEFK